MDTRTPLARKLRRYYPWVTPVTGPDGALIDVLLQHRELREAARACQQQARALEAGRRGYRQGRRVRPTGLMPFLNMEGEEKA